MFSVLLLFLPLQSLGQPQCGEFTKTDMEGPFYEPNAPKSYELAPQDELNDPKQAVILKGQVLDCSCKGIGGALVEVWYAGGNPAEYTFPENNKSGMPASPEVWYRGKVKADDQGRYEFKATFPGIYEGRPIIHYHYKVTAKETEFITQAYFKDKVPPRYQDYVKGRDSQYAKEQKTEKGKSVTFNVRLRLY